MGYWKGSHQGGRYRGKNQWEEQDLIEVYSLLSIWRKTMFGKTKKSILLRKSRLFEVRWYPSNRSCVSNGSQRVKAQQMPPLMVRKAQWRR